MEQKYDAILVLSFGGPEGPDDVMPFLENVLRGRPVPEERKLEVAEHYQHFGGVSPINAQNRMLIAALEEALRQRGIDLPIYWGNRNWHPLLPDTVKQMRDDGVKRAVCFVTSAYSCWSGCRQYRENIAAAREEVGEGAPAIDKLRHFFNHPGFIAANADHLRQSLSALRPNAKVLFCAHSIPIAMAEKSQYVGHLTEACRLTAEDAGVREGDWELVYQSRSGPPHQPWLEPDVCDRIHELAEEGVTSLAVHPIGFVSDHMEVLFDLDEEAVEACQEHGIEVVRVPSAGTHPAFIDCICDLIHERITQRPTKRKLGRLGAWPDVCPPNCCKYR